MTHVFVYDLRNFKERADCQSRLDNIVDASYLGTPYFKQEEVDMLKATKVNGEMTLEVVIRNTLDERLERRMKKRVESGDYRVCAAHDLAPIFETAFNIKPKDLAKDDAFLSLLENSGLKLKNEENWLGLPKRPNIKQCQKKKKKGGKQYLERKWGYGRGFRLARLETQVISTEVSFLVLSICSI
jgi:hypothetical protein